jgi:pimeloyl-ACP methyl ester carboxylesterase
MAHRVRQLLTRLHLDELCGVPGWLDLPGGTPPSAAVLLLHPFGAFDRRARIRGRGAASGDVCLFDPLADALLEAGAAVARYDNLLHRWRRSDPERSEPTFSDLVLEAERISELLRGHPALGGAPLVLLGVSMGTELAVALAERAGVEARLVLVAPVAESRAARWPWRDVDRRLEWLERRGLIGRDGSVDLLGARALAAARVGWWEPLGLDEPMPPVMDAERLRAMLHIRHLRELEIILEHGDAAAPGAFYRDWSAQPPAFRRIGTLKGTMALHVGAEDWTTPPRQAWLLREAASPQLRTRIQTHPGLGHLLSPRSAEGSPTRGPFARRAVRAIVRDVEPRWTAPEEGKDS